MPLSTPKRPAPPPPTLDPAQMKIYFDRVDKNGNGLISVDELQEALYNGTEVPSVADILILPWSKSFFAPPISSMKKCNS